MREVQTVLVEGGAPMAATAEFTYDETGGPISEGWFLGVPELEESIFEVPLECELDRSSRPDPAASPFRAHSWGDVPPPEPEPPTPRRKPQKHRAHAPAAPRSDL